MTLHVLAINKVIKVGRKNKIGCDSTRSEHIWVLVHSLAEVPLDKTVLRLCTGVDVGDTLVHDGHHPSGVLGNLEDLGVCFHAEFEGKELFHLVVRFVESLDLE